MFTKKAGYDRMPYPFKVIAFFNGLRLSGLIHEFGVESKHEAVRESFTVPQPNLRDNAGVRVFTKFK